MQDSLSKIAPERRKSSTLRRAQGQRRRVMTAELGGQDTTEHINQILKAVAKASGLTVQYYTDPETGKRADAAKHAAAKLLLERGFDTPTIAEATGIAAIEIERSLVTGGSCHSQDDIIRRVRQEGVA